MVGVHQGAIVSISFGSLGRERVVRHDMIVTGSITVFRSLRSDEWFAMIRRLPGDQDVSLQLSKIRRLIQEMIMVAT